MKRLWIGAALLALSACRAEGGEGMAPGTEKPETKSPAADARADGGVPGQSAEATKQETELPRVLAMIDAMNQHEIASAKMAQKQAASTDVKEYATHLVTDHQKAADMMKKLVGQKRMDLASMKGDVLVRAQDMAAKEMHDKLSPLKGAAFDAAYMGPQASMHMMLAKMADETKRIAKDADLEGLMSSLAITAREHESRAETLLPMVCGIPARPGEAPKRTGRNDAPEKPGRGGMPGSKPR